MFRVVLRQTIIETMSLSTTRIHMVCKITTLVSVHIRWLVKNIKKLNKYYVLKGTVFCVKW